MKLRKLSRRDALGKTGLLVGAVVAAENLGVTASTKTPLQKPLRPFRYCLNTATIRGQKIGIVKEIQVAAKAGYDAIEPWVESIEDYVKNGGSLKDLKNRIKDSGLTLESAIERHKGEAEDVTERFFDLTEAQKQQLFTFLNSL